MGKANHVSTDRNGPQLTWAIGANAELAHIGEVKRGLQCRCICPVCRSDLVAKQGKVQQHHFAHAKGAECADAVETALHLAAKDNLAKRREIVLPEVEIQFPHSARRTVIAPVRRYPIESVEVERKLGSIIPDVIVAIGGRKLLVEVTLTHGVDTEKLTRVRELSLSCVEIDLSNTERELDREELETIVVDGTAQKRWLHNVRRSGAQNRKLSEATFLPWVERGFALHVDGCPIPARTWRQKPYANVADDCTGCEHTVAFDNGYDSAHGSDRVAKQSVEPWFQI